MKKLNREKATKLLFGGKRIRAINWDDNQFIEFKGGQVITESGELFDIMKSKENEWVEWSEPVEKSEAVISREEALSALIDGKKVRSKEWVASYLEFKDGQIVDEKGKLYDITKSDIEEWIIGEYKAPAKADTTNEIAELKAMIQKLIESKEPKTKDGRNAEVQANTTEMIKAVYGVTTPAQIQERFKNELESAKSSRDVERVVCEYIPYCWMGGRTLGTVSVYYSNMRKVIKELENETYKDVALALFLPPQSLYEASQQKVVNNKKEKIRNKNTFDPKSIQELIKKIKNKLESDDFSDKPRQVKLEREKAYWAYAYLTIVTGRRQAEILKSLSIEKREDGWYYCGISKDREDGKCIKAYSLDDDFVFLNELLAYVQEHIEADTLTQKQINSKFNNPFSNALKRITGTSFMAKEWREIYTEMMWIKSGNDGSNIDKRDFRAEVLGHEYDSRLSATEHYEGWEASDE